MVVAAVAVGAFAAATAGQAVVSTTSGEDDADTAQLASTGDRSGLYGVGGNAPAAAPAPISTETSNNAGAEVRKLTASQQVTQARLKREAEEARKAREAAEEAKRLAALDFVRPAAGTLTSGFGARWGTTHYGIDIANAIGTPIYAVADGVVVEAGPASGFGLWVRVQHNDGTVTVYGHMNSYSVYEGQKVQAGEQIAEIGNRGYSTGPHLHFEVWSGEGGAKIDPLSWLRARGVSI